MKVILICFEKDGLNDVDVCLNKNS